MAANLSLRPAAAARAGLGPGQRPQGGAAAPEGRLEPHCALYPFGSQRRSMMILSGAGMTARLLTEPM